MKSVIFWLVFCLSLPLLGCSNASKVKAGDSYLMFPIKDAMNTSAAKEKLNAGIGLYFGEQRTPQVIKSLGEYTTIKRTNSFNKSDKRACEWAFLSGMLALQKRALKEGGNAVIAIQSYYKKHLVNSTTEYECEAGALMAGITFKGEVVKLAK